MQAGFDQGHEVGALAQKLFPDGLKIGDDATAFEAVIALTQAALRKRKPLFEAAFIFNRGICRVDILNPAPNGAWDIIEVKSTTGLNEVHVEDLAFQVWVLANAGLKIRRCYLCHINADFVRVGPVVPKDFFVFKDVTVEAVTSSKLIADKLEQMAQTISLPESPTIQIGKHCDAPYACPLRDQCWDFLPEASVFTLYRGGAKGFAFLKQGIQLLSDIPADVKLTNNQAIQRSALISGQAHVDPLAIKAFLSQLEYPISFLDFETIGPAVPRYDHSRPYQQIPFQYSLHVLRSKNAPLEHCQFLAAGTADPRPKFMRQLRDDLPATGSVVVYNASFETSRLKEGGKLLPEFKPWLKTVLPRIVDLLLPFRGFRYYHPAQNGSASMKAVLPALTGKSYQGLTIQEGGTASREFLRVTYGNVPAKERERVRHDLAEYCGLDTQGMVDIIQALEKELCELTESSAPQNKIVA